MTSLICLIMINIEIPILILISSPEDKLHSNILSATHNSATPILQRFPS